MERPRTVIIGAGNVAWHLAQALDVQVDVAQVFAPHSEKAKSLCAHLVGAQATDKLEEIYTDADFYIISVKDDCIEEVAKRLPKVKGIVVHTSGSVSLEALSPIDGKKGVLYPLQTFSKDAEVDVSKVPFFIEGSDKTTENDIKALARLISPLTYIANSEQRKLLHIAAVFGCNFFNQLLYFANRQLASGGYTLDVLKPLLETTLAKAMKIGPYDAQTGPAVRKDLNIIQDHLSRLEGEEKNIYRILSDSIINTHNEQ